MQVGRDGCWPIPHKAASAQFNVTLLDMERDLLRKLKKAGALLSGRPSAQPVTGQLGGYTSDLPYSTAKLFVWRPATGKVNFGDFLSRVIVDLMLATRGYTLGDETHRP